MIIESLQQAIHEITDMWSWIMGIIAGWGLTFTAVVCVLIIAHIRITRLTRQLQSLENRQVTDNRELSFRITKLEK